MVAAITHSARVVGPIYFEAPDGRPDAIPVGPCVIEKIGPLRVGIFWGPAGEESAVLALSQVESAELSGRLVVLD
jgi:hypothetical protein